jgi:hypothetical protein
MKNLPQTRTRQTATCALRIADPVQRERFVEMMIEAGVLFTMAGELRRAAWEIYRANKATP